MNNNISLYAIILCSLFASCTVCTVDEKKGEFTLSQETIDAFPFKADPNVVATPDTFVYTTQDSSKIYIAGHVSAPIKTTNYFKSYPDPGECDSIREYVQTERISLDHRTENGIAQLNINLSTGIDIEKNNNVDSMAVFERINVRLLAWSMRTDSSKQYNINFDIILDKIQNEISNEYRLQLNEATAIQDTTVHGYYYETLFTSKATGIEVFYALDKGLVYIEFDNGDYWKLD